MKTRLCCLLPVSLWVVSLVSLVSLSSACGAGEEPGPDVEASPGPEAGSSGPSTGPGREQESAGEPADPATRPPAEGPGSSAGPQPAAPTPGTAPQPSTDPMSADPAEPTDPGPVAEPGDPFAPFGTGDDVIEWTTDEFDLEPGQERYLCFARTVDEPLVINGYANEGKGFVHHLIFARTSGQTEGFEECDTAFRSAWQQIYISAPATTSWSCRRTRATS